MKIKVLKTTKAASSIEGTHIKEYVAGETYEIFQDLADVFVREGWGESVIEEMKKILIEKKAVEKSPENKAILSAPENKGFEGFSEEESEEIDREIVGSTESSEVIQKTKKRGKK